ncbi:MAG: LytR C-terminal domain-containing protein, partial [Alphaproteobacteria bacterium]
ESSLRDVGPPPPLSARPGTGAASELTRARIEVANGAGRRYMARRMGAHLLSRGARVWWISNDRSFDSAESVVYYRPGFETEAQALAGYLLPVAVDTQPTDAQQAELRLRLGGDMLDYDLELIEESWRPRT